MSNQPPYIGNHTATASSSNQPPPPPPAPWGFANAYSQPLPPAFQFNPNTGFASMAGAVGAMRTAQTGDQRPRVNDVVATYKNDKAKRSWLNDPQLTPQDKAEYEAGGCMSTAVKKWVSGGSIGVVTSPVSSASDMAQGRNEWHTVAMAREGNKVWVHDPEYDVEAWKGKVPRGEIKGAGMVHKLIQEWPAVDGVFFQGPPPTYLATPNQMECMGRSMQWVDATCKGGLPWPPDSDSSGGQWKWHWKN